MPRLSGLSVPRQAYPAFKLLADLSVEQAESVQTSLAAGSVERSARDLADRIVGVGQPMTKSAATNLIQALFNLSMLHFTHNWSISDVADAVAEDPAIELSAEQRSVIAARLKALVSLDAVSGLAKASSVAYDYDSIFHTVRILSDLRPVFAEDLEAGPTGVVVTHTLKIDYWHREGHKEFFVTLDGADLDELEKAIKRAKDKNAGLSAMMDKAGLVKFTVDFD